MPEGEAERVREWRESRGGELPWIDFSTGEKPTVLLRSLRVSRVMYRGRRGRLNLNPDLATWSRRMAAPVAGAEVMHRLRHGLE
jgi:hypothetical protein